MTGRHLGAISVLVGGASLLGLTAWLETLNGGLDAESWWYLTAMVALGVPAGILITKRPRHSVSRLLVVTVLLLAGNGFGWEYGRYAAVTNPGALPVPRVMAIPIFFGVFGVIVVFGVLLPLVFPTGAPPSQRWWWPAWTAATGLTLLFVPNAYVFLTAPLADLFGGETVAADRPLLDAMTPVGIGLLLIGLVGAFTSVVVRFRRSTDMERAQLKWFVLAASVLGLGFVLEFGGSESLVSGVVLGLGALAVPAAVTVALLRYRLYEIDRIVSRTVTYAIVAAVVGFVYAVPVLLLPRTFGGSSDLVVAGSTLAAAAVFNPVRRRVHTAVDRRFDRARYNAEQEVEALAARLRLGAGLEAVTFQVGQVLRSTLGPASAALWIREGER